MPCKREARFRHNTIAFWLSDEEKKKVEARIILSGLQKGEYYRAAILGQKVEVQGNRYLSARLAAVLERMYAEMMLQKEKDTAGGSKANPADANCACTHECDLACDTLISVLKELLIVWQAEQKNN